MRIIFFAVIVLTGFPGSGQETTQEEADLEELVDDLLAGQDEDLNYEELYENLALLRSQPADLNKMNAEQLRALFILDETQIQGILDYREKAGPFISLYELQSIPQLDRQTFERLTRFVTLVDARRMLNGSFLKQLVSEKNNYLIARFDRTVEEKAGYSKHATAAGRYVGSPVRMYTRFRTSRPGDFSIGFTAEKDAGEQLAWAPGRKQYGPGFLSFHAQVFNKKKIENLLIGDYQAQFGQGLVLGSAFGIGKNAESVSTARRPTLGFLPYTSAYEAGYFRGLAGSYALTKSLHIHGFFSSRWRDGNPSTDSTGALSTSSLSTTGLHRTVQERKNQNTVQERNFGAVIEFKRKRLDAGALFHLGRFSIPLQRNVNLYNQFHFQGSSLTNSSVYLNYTFRNISFFSESAYTLGHGAAVVAGSVASVTSALELAVHYRNFSRDYHTLYSNAISENTTPQNERALYWGWKYTFNKKYRASGYFDWFRFNWLRFRSYQPSEGHEWLLRFSYQPARHVSFFAQMREENKIRNQAGETNLYRTAPGVKRNYWLNTDYTATPFLSLRTRVQYSTYHFAGNASTGLALIQDLTVKRNRLTIHARYALFDTDNYDNRLYAYEKDVWLAFSFPAYYGVGVRSYLLAQYQVTPGLKVWLRWARTNYVQADTIGSGSELIPGNTRNDLKFQARFRL